MPETSIILPLWMFIMLMVGTPGPANLLMMSAGAQCRFKACMPFNAGLIAGMFTLNIFIGLGLSSLLLTYPTLNLLFKIISACYIIFLTLKSWNTVSQQQMQRLSFTQGFIVHPLNPKAWVMSTLAFSQFGLNLGDISTQLLIIPASFSVAQLICHTSWCYAGVVLTSMFKNSLILQRTLSLLTIVVVLCAVLFN